MKALPCMVAALLVLPAGLRAHDYPTAEPVVSVQDCMRAHPGRLTKWSTSARAPST